MNLIPEYVTASIAKEYSVENQQNLLRAWAQRFKAFCTSLPAISAAAISAGAPNIFTAGNNEKHCWIYSHVSLLQRMWYLLGGQIYCGMVRSCGQQGALRYLIVAQSIKTAHAAVIVQAPVRMQSWYSALC